MYNVGGIVQCASIPYTITNPRILQVLSYIEFLLENDGKEKGAGWASFAHLGWAIVSSLGSGLLEFSYTSSEIQGVLLKVVAPLDSISRVSC